MFFAHTKKYSTCVLLYINYWSFTYIYIYVYLKTNDSRLFCSVLRIPIYLSSFILHKRIALIFLHTLLSTRLEFPAVSRSSPIAPPHMQRQRCMSSTVIEFKFLFKLLYLHVCLIVFSTQSIHHVHCGF